jgi:hypothetical protein
MVAFERRIDADRLASIIAAQHEEDPCGGRGSGDSGAPLPRVRFHDLRHSHANQLLPPGIHQPAGRSGAPRAQHHHDDLDLYSHVTETMQEDAAKRPATVLNDY